MKWVASRSETFLSDYHGRAVRMAAELALDAQGLFIGIRHDWVCDIGAYPSAAGPFTNTFHAPLMATGAYRIPSVHGTTRLVLTNTVPITAYRGAGRPDMAYIVERLVDEAAAQTGIDRVALRRRNLIPRTAFPYALAAAHPCPAPTTAPISKPCWGRRSRYRGGTTSRPGAPDPPHAAGCVASAAPCSSNPRAAWAPSDQIALTFDPDGSLVLHEVAIASGQGHETVLPEIVGRALQIDPAPGSQSGPAVRKARWSREPARSARAP